MNPIVIGLLFILAGLAYGSLAIDSVYSATLGWLVENQWVKPPVPGKESLPQILGRKPVIIFYSLCFIIIGLFIIWNRQS